MVAALREKGWVEGRNFLVEQRNAQGRIEMLAALAKELVQAGVEVIVAIGPNATNAAKRATATVPIVFVAADAVINGLVTNLAQPSGNATGYSSRTTELNAKGCSLLREAKPGLRRVCLLQTAENPQFRLYRSNFDDSCRVLGLLPIYANVGSVGKIGDAIAQAARDQAEGLVLIPDTFTNTNLGEIIRFALAARLAPVSSSLVYAREGALLAYSAADEPELLVADYVDRILRGAKPAALPVQQPTRFGLAVNLKSAAILGISIPASLLIRATEVIQ